MIEKKVASARGMVYYQISDNWDTNGKTIFFLHGLTGNHTMFEKQVSYFEKNFNIIVWDAPAHGKSRPYAEFSYQNAVEDMKQILDDNGIEKVIMIGQSLGGYFIQSFLLRYPEMVQAFVGIDTTPYGIDYYSKSDMWWLRQVEWMAKLFPHKMLVKAIAKQVSVTEYTYNNMLEMLKPYEKNELCHLMGIGYASIFEENCDMDIKCPVLILLGERDRTGKVKQYCNAWAKKTGFPLVLIKNAAHNANCDNPEDVNKAIEEFLKKHIPD